MAYLTMEERDARLVRVRQILEEKKLDAMLIYYDEFNIANAWYLTGWCPQFESGAVLVPLRGEPMILGGPESEPFAKQDSAIKETRNLPCFMVPDEEYPNAVITDFDSLFKELEVSGKIKRVGLVGLERMPVGVFSQIQSAFKGVEMPDVTDQYVPLRYDKSVWEREMIRKGFTLADAAIQAMRDAVQPGASEVSVAAAGEFAARRAGASGFGFTAIVGSGPRANAVVPTAGDRLIQDGEMVMLGIAPKWQGYNGVAGDTVLAGNKPSPAYRECMKHLSHTFNLTKAMLKPGKTGREIDAPGRAYYEKIGWMKYLVCPFAHTIGLNEAETPFWGPNSDDVLRPGMTVCIDVSFFGHPELNGTRIETGYEITDNGPVPLSPAMDRYLTTEIAR